ncbi:alpha-amylase family glycosyl hydrolase [Sporosarcina sp. FSL K6-3457]|uniref:alpha-amylase family glycosyl hydrolase n=1 Tax=Sporosarcina sp. FSL K6-3457 TaxID=2978204 RepID=UPI0040469CA6
MKRIVSTALFIVLLVIYAMPQLTAGTEERQMQDEIIYSIMVDRFNNGDANNDKDADPNDPLAYHGGDFKGVTEKLDYLKDMGFTAIWLTPIFDNMENGYHGYWIKDFYKTNEYFGTMEEFKTLVQEAHNRDMKVILDFVVNHVGPNHEWLDDPSKEDWFHEKKPITNWNNQDEVENGWLYDLPDLNQDNPDTRKYLLDAAKWWIQETDIDGYRLDTVKHVPKDFWIDFSAAVKSQKKSFYLLGEVWHNNPNVVTGYQDTGIDGFMDFSQNDSMRIAFEKSDQSLGWLFSNINRNDKLFDHPAQLGQFLDNHDMSRFANLASNNGQDSITRWKLGLSFLYTAPGIPIIYYGSEIAMPGGNDPDNRGFMNFNVKNDLADYITKLGAIRRDLPSLTRGDMELLYEAEGMAVFKRTYQDETVVVAINNSSQRQEIVLGGKLEQDKVLRGLIDGELIQSDGNKYSITLEREKSEIYTLTDKAGINGFAIAVLTTMLALLATSAYLIRKGKRNRRSMEFDE